MTGGMRRKKSTRLAAIDVRIAGLEGPQEVLDHLLRTNLPTQFGIFDPVQLNMRLL
jgi:hypothetical protein